MPVQDRSALDPLRSFRFRVAINDNIYAFSEVTIPDKSTELVKYYAGDLGGAKLSGRNMSGTASFKSGVYIEGASDKRQFDFLHKWQDAVNTTGANNNRCDVTVTVLDEAGEDTSVAFQLINAWPIKYENSELAADANDVFIETLELIHEGIERLDSQQDTAMFPG